MPPLPDCEQAQKCISEVTPIKLFTTTVSICTLVDEMECASGALHPTGSWILNEDCARLYAMLALVRMQRTKHFNARAAAALRVGLKWMSHVHVNHSL